TPVAPPPVSSEAPLNLSVALVRIQGANIRLVEAGRPNKPEFKDVNFELRNFSSTAAMPFSLDVTSGGGGTLKLTGTAGPIAKAKTEQSPFDAQIEIAKLDIAGSGFTDPAAGLAGLISFKGTANSNGATAAIKGAVTLDNLKLSKTGKAATRPVAANIALVHNLATRHGEVARSIVKLGSASATVVGSYNLAANPPAIDAKLTGPNMSLTELAAFLPMFDIVLPAGATIGSGTASLDVASKGTLAKLNTSGSIKLEKAQLSNYDLGSKLRLIGQFAGIPTGPTTEIQLLGASFESTPAGTTVRDIQLVAPALAQITGQGSVSPDHALDFHMRATIKTAGLLAAAMQQKGDASTVPFVIQGTSSNPSFKPDLKSFGNEKLQQAMKNPEGAIKTAKGILDLFKKAPKQESK
ncbi:MAG: hypothetical protein ABI995_15645, partial [Acidobacteriota bacterium]